MTPKRSRQPLFPDGPETERSPVPRRDQNVGTGIALKRYSSTGVLMGIRNFAGLGLEFPARRSFFQYMCQTPRLNVGESARLRDRSGSRAVKTRPEAARS